MGDRLSLSQSHWLGGLHRRGMGEGFFRWAWGSLWDEDLFRGVVGVGFYRRTVGREVFRGLRPESTTHRAP